MVRSYGDAPATTAELGVIGEAALLPVFVSPGVALVALNCGCVPMVVLSGVTGT